MPTIIDKIQIAPDEVCTEFCTLDTSKACGPDNIVPFLLQNTAILFYYRVYLYSSLQFFKPGTRLVS